MLVEDIRLTGTSFVHETAQASPILSAPHTFCWLIALPVRSSVPDTYHNSLAPGQLKGIMQAPLVMACHFPIPVITGVFPQLPSVPEPLGAPVCDRYVPGHCTPEMVAALYSGVSTLSVRESSQICLDVPKDCDVGTGPILLPLKTFLQGQGHGVTDS